MLSPGVQADGSAAILFYLVDLINYNMPNADPADHRHDVLGPDPGNAGIRLTERRRSRADARSAA